MNTLGDFTRLIPPRFKRLRLNLFDASQKIYKESFESRLSRMAIDRDAIFTLIEFKPFQQGQLFTQIELVLITLSDRFALMIRLRRSKLLFIENGLCDCGKGSCSWRLLISGT